MAGEARSSSFMLGTATVMIGPMSALWDLTPEKHSIGLVKNFTVSSEPTYTDLTQGVMATVVATAMTSNPVTAAMEVYEYTSKNLAYSLGLDGSSLVAAGAQYLTQAALTGNDTTPVTTLTFKSPTSVVADFPIGTWISIQDPVLDDQTHYAMLTAAATSTGTAPDITHTLTFANHGLKTGNNFSAGAKVQKVTQIGVGSSAVQPYFSAKVIAPMPDGGKSIGILFPKIKISRGFNLAFSSENWGNMPFQFKPFDLLPADPMYNQLRGKGPAILMNP